MKIGVFDSGYGGLTILKQMLHFLPEYDYVYLGDNARAPYGSRSFDVVYHNTLECVKELFERDCQLVILACNTASAKALRTIQQQDLPKIAPNRRVLGVIRPTVEIINQFTENGHVGLVATEGTVRSNSYPMEIHKLFPHIQVVSQACPMWVLLIENNEHLYPGADYFVESYLKQLFQKDTEIDTVILGCTHYPLLIEKIKERMPQDVKIVRQGEIVALSLIDYLKRHPEHETLLSKNGSATFLTTECVDKFQESASLFLSEPISAQHVSLGEYHSEPECD